LLTLPLLRSKEREAQTQGWNRISSPDQVA
jgi:hypothetical protein